MLVSINVKKNTDFTFFSIPILKKNMSEIVKYSELYSS